MINTLKSILEVMFFYHPALWWISSVFDTEREHCCDDITLSASIQPISLSKALVSAAEYSMSAPRLAPAFYKKHQSLFKRIRRMNTKKHQTQKFNGRPVALAVILTGLLAFVISSSFTRSDSLVNLDSMMPDQTIFVDEANNSHSTTPDGDKSKPTKITTADGSTYLVYFKGGSAGKEISEVWLDGKEVPESKWKGNEDFFLSNEQQSQEKSSDKKVDELTYTLQELYLKNQKLKDELTVYKNALLASNEDISQEQKETLKKLYYLLAESEKTLDKLKIEMANTDESPSDEMLRKTQIILLEEKEALQRANLKLKNLMGEDMSLTEAELKEIKAEQAEMKERMKPWYPLLTEELAKDGIIKEGVTATVLLSLKVMEVNDVKQAEKVHQKYLELFEKVRGESLGLNGYAFILNSEKEK